MTVRETITISMSPELRTFVRAGVATGRYSSISEVVRAALRDFENTEAGKASTAIHKTVELSTTSRGRARSHDR